MECINNFLYEGTNFKLAVGIYDVIYSDCIYFGFIKNNRPNISGFLNHIIHHLSYYREDLHNDFLKKNNNNSELALIIERNIYDTYLKTFDIANDSYAKAYFRINKEHLDTFINIVDNHLPKYQMDFTTYIKTLLLEYAIKPQYQREYFAIYNYSKLIVQGINNSQFVKVRTSEDKKFEILPCFVNYDLIQNQLYLFGFTKNKEDIVIIKYSQIKSVVLLEDKMEIDETDFDKLIEVGNNFLLNLSKDLEDEGE